MTMMMIILIVAVIVSPLSHLLPFFLKIFYAEAIYMPFNNKEKNETNKLA